MQKGLPEEVTSELNPEGCVGIARQRNVEESAYLLDEVAIQGPQGEREFGTLEKPTVNEVGRLVQEW